MFLELYPVDAHDWLIRICRELPDEVLFFIGQKLVNKCETDLYLSQCLLLAQEQKEDPTYCADFDSVCKTIVRISIGKNDKKVKKRDYAVWLKKGNGEGWLSNEEIDRLASGKGKLYMRSVDSLCSHIGENSPEEEQNLRCVRQCFWKNQVLLLFPLLFREGRSAEATPQLEQKSLERLLEFLPEKVLQSLSEHDPEFKELYKAAAGPGKPERTEADLYEIIMNYLHVNDLIVDDLSADELRIASKTWYNWRSAWKKGNKSAIPRWAMLYLAIRFDLDYLEMLQFLQLAGYRPGYSELDMKIRLYFATRQGAKEELLQELRQYRPR